jgi:hypothetical protein
MLWLCCWLCALSFSAGAQQAPGNPAGAAATAPARGTVRTTQGVAVPGATVRLVELSTGRTWLSWTDENGNFDLPGLPAGKYRVEAEQLGFEPASVEATLQPSAAPAPGEAPKNADAAAIVVTLHVVSVAALNAPPIPANPAPAATAAKPPAEESKTSAAAAKSSTPGAGQPNAQTGARPGAQRPGQPGANNAQSLAEMMRRRMQQGGFQQVDLNGQPGGAGGEGAGPADAGPLGDASSSDAFLISGTVGRGASGEGEGGPFGNFGPFGGIGGPGGVPGFGGPGEGGVPGQPGMGGQGGQFNVQVMGGGRGPQQQQGGRGGRQGQGQAQGGKKGQGGQQGQGGQNRGNQQVAFGQGTEALYGLQRILRQQLNRVRFSFYERYGNSELDARPYSLTEPNPAKIATYRERGGMNLGGPLVIPHVYNGRERTFFFVNYDFGRTRDPVDTFATVPLPDERKGDFTARGVQLFDPASNLAGPRRSFCPPTVVVCSVIPPDRLDKAAVGLLQFIPLPNLPGLTQNFHLQTRVPTATDRLNVRIIHTISPKLNAQVTYNLSETRTHALQSFPDFESNSTTRGQNLMLGLTQSWTQKLIHDTRVFFTRSRTGSLNQFAFNDNVAGDLGIQGISTDAINFGVPLINLTNFNTLNDPVPALRRNQTVRFLDNFSYSQPKHTWRGGFELRRIQINTTSDPTPRGSFTFTGLMTSQLMTTIDPSTGQPVTRPVQGTGFDFADFLLGLPQATSARFGSSSTYFRSWGLVGYMQDDWRIRPRFSLNWGLRYEAVTPPVELFNRIANLDVSPDVTAVALVVPGDIAKFSGVLPNSLVRGDYNNWSPRLGIAWRPPIKWLGAKHPMTIRAGYGVFYNTSIYNQLAASMANQPPFAQAQTLSTSAAQVLTLENGFPPAPAGVARNTIAVDPNYRVGYAQLWNMTVETQLATSTVLDLTYTGTKGTRLDLLRAPNRTAPGSVLDPQGRSIVNALGFTFDSSGASSIYHALQVRVQKRMSKGLMILGQYTYAKSIDNASSIGGGAQTVVQDDTRPDLDRGLSSFDIRHQFRMNYVYELPFGERKRWAQKGWKGTAFGHWQLNGSATVNSGTPFTARVLGTQSDITGTGSGFSERADQIGNPVLPADQRTVLRYFNTDAFTLPLVGRFGDAARNTIPGPGTFNISLAAARFMRFGKDQQRRIDLRWEVSNLTNTPNFSGLYTVDTATCPAVSPLCQSPRSSLFGQVSSVRAMRTIDFQMRVNF